MRTKLLSVIALCGAMASALPMSAAGNWVDPELEFVTPNLTEDETGGGVYYLYHVASGRFMADGYWNNNWGTEAEVCEEGQAITLSWGQDYELSRRATTDAEYHDAYGWRMSMKEGQTNSDLHELYIPSGLSLCVDHNTQGHMLWHIISEAQDDIELGEGCYQICILESDPTYGTSSASYGGFVTRVGVDTLATATYSVYGINPLIIEGEEGVVDPKYDWKFVDPDVYEVYIAKKSLQAQLESADEAGFTDYATYAAIYNSTTATADEIEEAAEDLQSDLLQYKYSNASADSPADLTDFITNPDFESSTSGWTTYRSSTSGNFQRQTNTSIVTTSGTTFSPFFERWVTTSTDQGTWYIEQELTGLPDGVYTLGAYAFTVDQADYDTYEPNGFYLRATTVAGTFQTECLGANDYTNSVPVAAPFSVEFTVIGNTATIGFYSEGDGSGNWNGVSRFTLNYMGTDGALTASSVLTSTITEAETLLSDYDNDNLVYSNAGLEAYNAAISTAKAASADTSLDDDALLEATSELRLAMDTLTIDVNAYTTLYTLINQLYADWDESDYANYDFDAYADYLTELENAYKNRTFDPAEIDSVESRAEALWQQAIFDEIQAGNLTNVTGLLTNADFSTNSSTGWTATQTVTDISYGTIEMYNYSTFDVYQELTGLPSGSYTVTCQGFYRPASNATCQSSWGSSDGVNDVLVYLYANDASVKLNHCYDYVYDTQLTSGDVQLTSVDTSEDIYGKYAANNIQGASLAFEAGDFVSTVTCFVTEDGVLRVGINKPSSEGSQSSNWTAFDNFQVTFLGSDDMSGAQSALSALISSATDSLNSDKQVTADAKEVLNTAIVNANAALLTELTVDTYSANVTALNDAMDGFAESAAVVAELVELLEYHDSAINKSEYDEYDNANQDLYEEFCDLIADLLDNYVDGDMVFANADSVEAKKLAVNMMFSQMVASTVDTEGASLDNGVDVTGMIQSPSFSTGEEDSIEASDTGWTANGGEVTSAYNYEFYQVEDANLYQILYALPKGYYRLGYNGFYRAGNYTPAAQSRLAGTEELNASVYVSAGENYWSKTMYSIFDFMHEFKYDSSDAVLPDSLFPESTLLYNIIVNMPVGADEAYEDGNYADSFSFYVEEDGQAVTLGVNKTGLITGDWVNVDNFTLTYYGDGSENQPSDYVSAIDEVAADANAASVVSTAWYTINGVRVAEPAQQGIYIRQQVLSDGTKNVVKVVVK